MGKARVLLFDIDGTLVNQQLNTIFPIRKLHCRQFEKTSAKQITEEKTAKYFLNTIQKNITDFTLSFFGSGDFHHLTAMILQQLHEPFFILMFDRHYDIGSKRLKNHSNLEYHCGAWLYSALQLPLCKGCLLVGPQSNKLTRWLQGVSYLEKNYNLHVIEGKDSNNLELFKKQLHKVVPADCKIYTTIDKDALQEDVVETDWGSGNITAKSIESMLQIISTTYTDRLIGVDICGDPRQSAWFSDNEYSDVLNQHAILNRKILKIFYNYIKNPYENNWNNNSYSI